MIMDNVKIFRLIVLTLIVAMLIGLLVVLPDGNPVKSRTMTTDKIVADSTEQIDTHHSDKYRAQEWEFSAVKQKQESGRRYISVDFAIKALNDSSTTFVITCGRYKSDASTFINDVYVEGFGDFTAGADDRGAVTTITNNGVRSIDIWERYNAAPLPAIRPDDIQAFYNSVSYADWVSLSKIVPYKGQRSVMFDLSGIISAELKACKQLEEWDSPAQVAARRAERRKEIIKRAEENDVEAQMKLYYTDPDSTTGLGWLCRAADQLHPLALQELGTIFQKGRGCIEPDRSRSWLWYSLAVKGNKIYVSKLESVAESMSSAQLLEAKELLNAWKPGNCERDLSRLASEDCDK